MAIHCEKMLLPRQFRKFVRAINCPSITYVIDPGMSSQIQEPGLGNVQYGEVCVQNALDRMNQTNLTLG